MFSTTIIIPVLNAMPFLTEMLESLEKQTCHDFEVMLWDNGSTDATVEEARRWIPSRLPGRVVCGQPLPLAQCLAAMVEKSETEFCARMDGDDYCCPDRLLLQHRFLREHPEIDLVGCQIECMDADGKTIQSEEWSKYPVNHEDIISRMMFYCPFNHPSILFRREAVLRAGNYEVPAPVEDLNLYLKLVQQSTVANLSRIGVRYRLHGASISAGAKTENKHALLAEASLTLHAEAVFGIPSPVYQRLRAHDIPISAVPLIRSAWKRSGRSLRKCIKILCSPWFIDSARCLTRRGDFISKLIFRLLAVASHKSIS